uniref:Uncharacterized protein n=1 Tax=Macrostomum lignano TaxID=282301 RepID=A0A1I8GKH8_9PLAT
MPKATQIFLCRLATESYQRTKRAWFPCLARFSCLMTQPLSSSSGASTRRSSQARTVTRCSRSGAFCRRSTGR